MPVSGPFLRTTFLLTRRERTRRRISGQGGSNLGDRHRLTFDFNISNGLPASAPGFLLSRMPGGPDRNFQIRRGSLQYVFPVSSHTVNTPLFSIDEQSRSRQGAIERFPVYQIDPYLNFGAAFPESHIARNTFDLSDGLSTRRGKHSLNLYGRFVQYQVNVFWPQYPSGYFDFSSGLTSLPELLIPATRSPVSARGPRLCRADVHLRPLLTSAKPTVS